MVKVSLIVPVYNTEQYLDRCLSSLVRQTLQDIEVIVVNDGSTDNSQRIINKYKKEFPKLIQSFIKENGGQSEARNYGLERANGEYIMFVDSDDWVSKEIVELMYHKAVSERKDIVVGDVYFVYKDGRKELHKNLDYSRDAVRNYIISQPMPVCKLFHKKVLRNVRFQVGKIYEDLELIPSLVSCSNKITFINKGLYYYYQTDNSTMRKNKFNDNMLDIFDIMNSLSKKINKKKYKEELEFLYITHLLRSSGLRLVSFNEGRKYLQRINNIMKKEFPDWKQNCYYKKSSYRFKLICNLIYYRKYSLLKLIKKVSGKNA